MLNNLNEKEDINKNDKGESDEIFSEIELFLKSYRTLCYSKIKENPKSEEEKNELE